MFNRPGFLGQFAFIFLLALLLLPVKLIHTTPALAQSEPSGLSSVILSVYPEYDDPYNLGYPTVLVMIEGYIENAEPPATIRFLVPKDAIMYSAGSGPRDRYVGGPPERRASDIVGWDEISYTLVTDYFVVEYYSPIQSTAQKDFSAGFIPLYPVDGLTVLMQQPRRATKFGVSPPGLTNRPTAVH